MTDINAAIAAAASGMRAQTVRMRIAAENVANANSTGDEPERRAVPPAHSAAGEHDARLRRARRARDAARAYDMSAFREEYNPSHPAADADGYVQLPNVDTLVEMMDLREATRAYEANLNMIEAARDDDDARARSAAEINRWRSIQSRPHGPISRPRARRKRGGAERRRRRRLRRAGAGSDPRRRAKRASGGSTSAWRLRAAKATLSMSSPRSRRRKRNCRP